MSGVTTQTGGRKERFLNKEVAKISRKGSAFLPSPLILQKLQPPDCILDNLSLLGDLCNADVELRAFSRGFLSGERGFTTPIQSPYVVAAMPRCDLLFKSVFATFGGSSLNMRPPLFQFRVAFRSNDLSLLCDLCDLLFKIRLCDLLWNLFR